MRVENHKSMVGYSVGTESGYQPILLKKPSFPDPRHDSRLSWGVAIFLGREMAGNCADEAGE